MFWHGAVSYCLFGGGGQYCWYRIVSYRYTMLILSIVSNRLCLVSPTSTTHLFLPYLCRRWRNPECTQTSESIHTLRECLQLGLKLIGLYKEVLEWFTEIYCVWTPRIQTRIQIFTSCIHTHTHTLDSLMHMLVGTTHESRSAHDIHTIHIMYGSLTWFNAQCSDVQEGLLYPSLYAVPTLNKTAATWQYTSPRLKFQMQDAYHMIII